MSSNTFLHSLGLKHGSHENHSLHPTLLQNADILCLLLVLRSCAHGNTAVSSLCQFLLDDKSTVNMVCHPNIHNQNSHQTAGLHHQPPCRCIRYVVILFQQHLNLLPGFLLDSRPVVNHPGYRTGRHSCLPGYIINRHVSQHLNIQLPRSFFAFLRVLPSCFLSPATLQISLSCRPFYLLYMILSTQARGFWFLVKST